MLLVPVFTHFQDLRPRGHVCCRLTAFFKGLGVKAVLDTNTGRDIALLEAAAEFIQRYRAAHPQVIEEGTVGWPPVLLLSELPVLAGSAAYQLRYFVTGHV